MESLSLDSNISHPLIDLQTIQNQTKTRIIGCLRPQTMLKEITLTKSPRTTQLGSDSSVVSPNVVGHPSMTPTNPKIWQHLNGIFSM